MAPAEPVTSGAETATIRPVPLLHRPGPLAGYLALVMGIGPLVHYAISALGPLVVADLRLSATEFGLLWFVTFGAAGLCTITGGRLTDRFGAPLLLGAVFAVSLAALLTAGLAGSYGWLVVALALSGIAQSVSNPATNSVVAGAVAAPRRGLVLGFKQSGVQMAQFAAGLALPTAALVLGWRAAVLCCAVVAVAGLAVTAAGLPREPRRAARGAAARRPLPAGVRWMTVFAFLMGVVTQATNVYLPLYAHDALGMSVAGAGAVAAVLGGVGVAARLAWGRLTDRIADIRAPLLVLALLAAAAMAAVTLAERAGVGLLWLGAGLFSVSALAANVLIMVAIVRVVPRDQVGYASGLASLGLYAGFMVGPVGFGLLVDALGGFAAAWSTAGAVGLVLAALTLVWRWRAPAAEPAPSAGRPPSP